MALTRITKGVIKPNENYDTHNINSTGIVTAIGLDINGNGDISGSLSVGGVLTYEDVTSIDSVGIITAQKDIHVGAGVSAVGVGTFGGLVSPYADIDDFLDVGSNIKLGNAGIVTAAAVDVDDFLDVGSNIKLGNAGVITATSFVGSGAALTGIDATAIKDTSGNVKIQAQASGAVHTGISTFQDIDVDGHTNLDNVSIAGVTSVANLSSGRVVLTGTGGKLEDSANLTFNGSQLSIGGKNNLSASHVTTYSGDGAVRFQMDVNSTNGVGVLSKNTSGSYNSYMIDAGTFKIRTTGTNSPQEKFRITSAGAFGFNTSTIRENIHTHQADSNQNYLRFTNTGTGTGTSNGVNLGITAAEEAIVWNFENTNMLFATNNTERLRILSDGKIGINQTTPTCQLQIDSGSSGAGTVTHLELNHKGNDLNDAVKLNFARAGSDIGSIVLEKVNNNNTTDFIFNTRASNTVSESMRITGAGLVGIGTNPTKDLHVDGTIFASGTTTSLDGGLRIEPANSGTTYGGAIFGGAHNDNNTAIFMRRGYDGTINTIDINSYGMFRVFTGGGLGSQTERLRIASDGTVSMGQVDSSSTSALHIRSVTSAETTLELSTKDNYNGSLPSAKISFTQQNGTEIARIKCDTNTGAANMADLVFWTNFGGLSERLRITKTGNVGIGEDAPDQKLHVYEQSGSSQAYIHVQNNRARNAAIKFTTTQGSWLVGQGIGVDADRLMVYDTEEKMSIDANGDVVIGTSSWSYKKPLNVQGSSGAILALSNYDTTTYAANTNTSIELRLNTGNTGSQNGSCEIRAFKENGTNGNNARGLNFWTAGNGGSPAERFRITSYGDVYSTNSAYNTYDTAGTNINTMVDNNEKRSGVYWINYGGEIFRAYIKANWCEDRNWILAAKFFDFQDMPSGSSLWTNDTYINESDFNLYGGIFSKYRAWRYFPFDRLAMQMGNRIPPIMRFSSNQTLYGAFSGGRASNGGGVTASSTYPAMSGTSVTYHSMENYMGPDFYDVGGSEDRMQSYGLNKWANNSTQTTSAQNRGSEHYFSSARQDGGSLQYQSLKGWGLTVEDSHPTINGIDSIAVAGAWIGCPLDEGGSTQGNNSSNAGSDSGFGFGFCSGNPGRTGTAGYAEWGRGTQCVNTLPAYIWLSAD